MKFLFGFLLVLTITCLDLSAQQEKRLGGSLSGMVVDSVTNHTIEYANIVLFSSRDNKNINGAISKEDGSFIIDGLRPGKYFIKITFMGYETTQLDNIVVNRTNPKVDLGTIKIKPSSVNLNTVVVEGERAPVSYQIDKKVINVEQFPMAASGTAVDVLENIPSVVIDIEGNVSLRGSGNFTVLIDGRPTILDPQDALQQLPASSIENIEIITNPSAKYNPEGTAGIINIVLKKNKNIGVSGLTNVNGGLNNKYGGEVLMELKNSSFSSILGLDYNKRFFPGNGNERRTYLFQGNTTQINSHGDSKRGRTFYGLRAGLNFNLSEDDLLSFSGRYGSREMKSNSLNTYTEFSAGSNLPLTYINKGSGERSGYHYGLNTNYQHKFKIPGNEFTADFSFHYNDGEDYDLSESINNQIITFGKKNTEDGISKDMRARLNYILPFDEKSKFEAGMEGHFELDEEGNGLFEYIGAANSYIFQPLYSYVAKTSEGENALYSLYSNMYGDFGYQVGIRGEYTYRNIEIPARNNEFTIDRWDYFPSAHFSYKFPTGQQIMASYSKRIQRPHGWSLEPFETWVDANTIRRGNPALLPEYIDSYELGLQTLVGEISISSEFYYRINKNKIENIRSVYSENVTLQTFENVGKDFSLGNEFLINADLFDLWNINLMANIYDYHMKGVLYGEEFNRSSFNWRTRLNNVFKLDFVQLQLNAEYNSPSVSSQGRREGFFTTDAAVRTDLLNKKLSLILQIRDLFQTGKYEFSTQTPGFTSYSYFERESPMVMLTMRLSINNYKQERERQRMNDDNGDFDED